MLTHFKVCVSVCVCVCVRSVTLYQNQEERSIQKVRGKVSPGQRDSAG